MGENHFYKRAPDLKGCPVCDIEGDPVLSIRSNSFFERWGGECQNCGFVMDGFLRYEDLIEAWEFLSKGFESTTIGDRIGELEHELLEMKVFLSHMRFK